MDAEIVILTLLKADKHSTMEMISLPTGLVSSTQYFNVTLKVFSVNKCL